jgi:RAB6A-GEF complex partner protein 2
MRRVHDAHYSSFLPSTLRTTFSLDIPPDASPAFRIGVGGKSSLDGGEEGAVVSAQGGLEWKVRLCLLVAVAREGALVRGFKRDGDRGAWGTSWIAEEGMAPMEKEPSSSKAGDAPVKMSKDRTSQGWAAFLAASILGSAEEEEEAVEEEEEDEEEEEGWRAVRVETVECEMPLRVWPGSTAFKTMEVVFDV